MAGGLHHIVESLTPGMAAALALLDNRQRRPSEIGCTGGTLFFLADRGLAYVDRLPCNGMPARHYSISERGREVLSELLNPTPFKRITVHEIQEATAAFYEIPLIEMSSQRRGREVAWPRQEAMYLAKKLTPLSLPQIGRLFGDRDHTTVIHAIRAVEKRIAKRWSDTLNALAEIERRVSE